MKQVEQRSNWSEIIRDPFIPEKVISEFLRAKLEEIAFHE